MKDLRQRTVEGLLWSGFSQWGQQGLKILITIILARLLSPREFGLIAMVGVIIGFARVFNELGFGAALIQKQDVRPEHLSSVFWLNVFSGLALTAIFVSGAPFIADFYNEPILLPLTVFLSINFLFRSLNLIQKTLLTKALDFRKFSIIQLLSLFAGGGAGIAMAYADYGVWSLAAQSVITSFVMTLLLWISSDWRPRFSFSWTSIQTLLGFSVNLLGTKTLNYWSRRFDNLLIGTFLGAAQLGLYSRAYGLLLFPLNNVKSVITQVLFPSFSVIKQDKKKIKRISLSASRVMALFIYPLMLGLLVTARAFVMTVFGPQWLEMVPILQIFCLLALVQGVIFPRPLYLSQGRTDVQFRVQIVGSFLIISGMLIGLFWGVLGIATGYAVASTVTFALNFYFSGQLVGLTPGEFLSNLSGVFTSALIMALLVWGLGLLLPASFPSWASLIVQGLLGIGVYGGLVHLFKVSAYQDMRSIINEQWQLRVYKSLPLKSS